MFVGTAVAFVAVVAPVQAGLALILALLVNMPLRGINLFRTVYFMPVVIVGNLAAIGHDVLPGTRPLPAVSLQGVHL